MHSLFFTKHLSRDHYKVQHNNIAKCIKLYLFRASVGRGKTQVADSYVASSTVNEDVVAFQIAVYDGRVLGVQVVHPTKDLASPALDHPPPNHFHLPDKTILYHLLYLL